MPDEEIEFDNDTAYLQWVQQHSHGFVINTSRSANPQYVVLHRATCPSITQYNHNAQQGGFTERDFRKICAEDKATLRAWLTRNGRIDGSFTSEECPMCRPSTP